jgi:hypothetical protein
MRFTNVSVRAYRQPPAALVGIMANEQLRHLWPRRFLIRSRVIISTKVVLAFVG